MQTVKPLSTTIRTPVVWICSLQVMWICSTPELPWKVMPAPAFERTPDNQPPEIRVDPSRTAQTIDGFGGCFNELGWAALNQLPAGEKARALQALFGQVGCAFTLGRVPIGASDFAQRAYSLDDTPGDLQLKDFSIERDRKLLLLYIKAAMELQPALRCWASPWSPPAWKKTNNHYSKGSLRWEPDILHAYAAYLTRWVETYRAEGVDIYAITPQNEPNVLSDYPTCLWTGPQLAEFIGDYLGPTLKAKVPDVELWLGLNGDPTNNGEKANARLIQVGDDPKASAFLTGIAFQYDSRNQIATASKFFPGKKLMQSETVCYNGDNSWPQAQRLYGDMKRYLENGANSYFAWNMVLDPSGKSTWNWRQNALITADPEQKQIRLNGEYYVMRHFSQFVKPGAKRALTSGIWGDQIGFVAADGSVVIVVGNSDKLPHAVHVALAGVHAAESLAITLPPASVSTFVIPAL